MGITDLTPLSGLTVLTVLWLEGNLFTDISPLSTLTTLEEIFLFTTPITDISALQNLTALTNVQLMDVGGLSDIQPLIDNAGLGAGDTVNLENVSPSLPCADVTALQGKGVTVSFTVCAS
jgi:Leucine-rich repeat (LRR) protein